MRTFYLRFRIYAIKIMAFQRNVSSNLPMLLVSLYANLLYASKFFRSLSLAYNEVRLYKSIIKILFQASDREERLRIGYAFKDLKYNFILFYSFYTVLQFLYCSTIFILFYSFYTVLLKKC